MSDPHECMEDVLVTKTKTVEQANYSQVFDRLYMNILNKYGVNAVERGNVVETIWLGHSDRI